MTIEEKSIYIKEITGCQLINMSNECNNDIWKGENEKCSISWFPAPNKVSFITRDSFLIRERESEAEVHLDGFKELESYFIQ